MDDETLKDMFWECGLIFSLLLLLFLVLFCSSCQGTQIEPYVELSYIESEAHSRADQFTSNTAADGMGVALGFRLVPPVSFGEVERELIRGLHPTHAAPVAPIIVHPDHAEPVESSGMMGFVSMAERFKTWTSVAALAILVAGGCWWFWVRRRRRKHAECDNE